VQAAGTLELVAELSVAFAGFSGIVGVYRSRSGDVTSPRDDLRLLVEYSIFVLALSLTPLFLWHGGVSEDSAWRLASLAAALYTIFYYWHRYRSILAGASEQEMNGTMRFYIACDWLLSALLVASAAGILPVQPVVPYLANLAFQLAGTAVTFMRFVAPLWRTAA